ncbi:universally conserved protein [Hyperthermus butylicus DSM 5456]|uniref:Universally conserved protein n=1 Tax=Hyperthermus butylicus (strain DSM 5456 / JCM 9403 / PLM1-5) TaxID=415426 RepID=A2BKE5_HYPBU|nr:universally conserved protein [Hyperthermus butylicus DSM 5456]
MEIRLQPIGVVRVDASDEEVKKALHGVEGVIEVFPEYEAGLNGIEGFSHIIVIAYLHKVTDEQRSVLRVRHRRLERLGVDLTGIPEVGVFCTDSPHRPNPIALSIVELVERKGRFLRVRGLDLFDGTPVLDIKGYDRTRCIREIRVPWWLEELEKRVGRVLGEPSFL